MTIKESLDKRLDELPDTSVVLWVERNEFEEILKEIRPKTFHQYLAPISDKETHYLSYRNKFIGIKK